MNIDLLKINGFGKLKDKEINLNKNINIIYGKNEQGKTTTLKFLSSMLYGISKNKNGKEMSDYDRYKPWEQEEFSGKIKYTLDNSDQIEVFREFNKKNPKIYNSNHEDISKEFSIDKNKGNQFFVEQTNIDEEIFCSSVLMEQKEITLDAVDRRNITQKMSNIISTGEDNTSYKKIIDKLNKKYIEEVGTDRTTERPLNIVKEKILKIKKEIKEIEINEENKNEIINKKNNINNEIKEIENKNKLLNEIKNINENNKIEKEKINIKNNLIEENKEKIKNIENNIKNQKNNNKKNNKEIFILLFIIILLIIFTFLFKIKLKIKLIISAILFLIFGINLFLIINKNKKTKNEKINKLNNEKNAINNIINEIENDINNLNKNLNIENEKEKQILISKYKNNNIKEIFDKDLEKIKQDIKQNEETQNNLKFQKYQIELKEENINKNIEEKINCEEKLKYLLEEEQEILKQAEAIKLTKEVLEKSYEKMKNNITPKFAQNLLKNSQNIIGNKYKKILFKEDEGIIVELENGNYINANCLSTGTIDQLYFALRIAVMEEVSQERLPIILDEAFAYYDEERLENILSYLNNNFSNNQIIIFTCSHREKDILDKLKISYNYVEL